MWKIELRSYRASRRKLRKAGFESLPTTAGYGPRHGWGRGSGSQWFRGFPSELTKVNLPSRGIELKGVLKVAAPVDADEGRDSLISQVAARAPYIAVADVVNGEIKDLRIIRNEASLSHGGAGVALAEMLSSMGINVCLAPNAGPNLLQATAVAGIALVPAPPGTKLRDAVLMLVRKV